MDVKITSVYSAYGVYNAPGGSIPKAGQAGKSGAKDSLSLSAQAGDYQTARKALAQLPDVREDRVAPLAARVAAGTYAVSADDIAAKMFREWNA